MTPFSTVVFDHYQHPRNAGQLDDANAAGQAENEACGDAMQLFARVENGRIVRASCKTFGCAPAVAAGSILTELLADVPLADAAELQPAAIEDALGGLPPMKRHAAQLAADVTHALVKNYQAATAS